MGRLTIAAAIVTAVVSGVWIAVVDDPDGGRPAVTVAVTEPGSETVRGRPAATASSKADASANDPATTGSLRSALREPPGLGTPDAGSGETDAALLEPSPFGLLPRISPDGRRARDVYAGRSDGGAGSGAAGGPQVAIVVGGLGLSQTGTLKALETLPPGVTLAFAPYGSSLQRWADKARGAGHELILQLPLEPDGYPASSPGEHTLTTAAAEAGSAGAGGDDLAWNLGRMTAYAGTMNYLGGRFLADDRATASLVGELGARGLYFLDDGSAPDSRASEVGETLQMPVLKADATIDAERTPERIAAQLAALEGLARRNGSALGVATGFPVTVDAVADWARDAASRGIRLVPASALIGHPAMAAQ